MNWWRRLFNRDRSERQLNAELQFHLEEQVRDYVQAGMSESEARRKARLAFGAVDGIREDCREAQSLFLMESTLQDLRYSVRGMRKSWVFTSVVVVSLALGIGANTAIFTLIDAVMWRMLPVRDPDTLLVAGYTQGSPPEYGFTYKQYRAMRDNTEIAELAGYSPVQLSVTVDGNLEPTLEGQLVSGNYFSLLGVNPVVGRPIGIEDDRVPKGHPVAMLSYGYWKRRFALEPSVIGRSILVSGSPFTVIGVTPPEFFGVEVGASPAVFVPMMMQPTVMAVVENLLENPIIMRTWVQTLARLKPGVSVQQALGPLETIYKSQIPPRPKIPNLAPVPERRLVLTSAATGLSDLRRRFSQPLFVLMWIVSIVLLIACANIANLLLARAASRRSELAMRVALGAGHRRLIRQLLAEAVLLALTGGCLGIALAQWATRFLVVYMSSGRTPIVLDLSPDLRILVFTAAVSILTGILFGLAPALRATRLDLAQALKNRTGSGRTTGSHLRPGKTLAIVQVSLSLLLLITAGLFVRSLQNIKDQDKTSERDHVLIVRVEPRGSDQRSLPGTSQRLGRLYTDLLQRVEQIPGVRSASLGNVSPTKPETGAGGRFLTSSGKDVAMQTQVAYPGYFDVLSMPILTGRAFTWDDFRETSPAGCVINETFARDVYEGENPIGKPCGGSLRSPGAKGPAVSQIIGVAKDSKYTNHRGLYTQAVLYAPFPFANTSRGQMILYARIAGDPGPIIPLLREEVWKADKDVPQFSSVPTLLE